MSNETWYDPKECPIPHTDELIAWRRLSEPENVCICKGKYLTEYVLNTPLEWRPCTWGELVTCPKPLPKFDGKCFDPTCSCEVKEYQREDGKWAIECPGDGLPPITPTTITVVSEKQQACRNTWKWLTELAQRHKS